MAEEQQAKQEKYLLVLIFSVILVWIGIVIYLFYMKSGSIFVEYRMDQLGQIGGFFNIATSFASIITVILVFIAYKAQINEFHTSIDVMKSQGEILKGEERNNRTLKYIEQWNKLRFKALSQVGSDDIMKEVALFFEWMDISKKTTSKIIDIEVIEQLISADTSIEKYLDLWLERLGNNVGNFESEYGELLHEHGVLGTSDDKTFIKALPLLTDDLDQKSYADYRNEAQIIKSLSIGYKLFGIN